MQIAPWSLPHCLEHSCCSRSTFKTNPKANRLPTYNTVDLCNQMFLEHFLNNLHASVFRIWFSWIQLNRSQPVWSIHFQPSAVSTASPLTSSTMPRFVVNSQLKPTSSSIQSASNPWPAGQFLKVTLPPWNFQRIHRLWQLSHCRRRDMLEILNVCDTVPKFAR